MSAIPLLHDPKLFNNSIKEEYRNTLPYAIQNCREYLGYCQRHKIGLNSKIICNHIHRILEPWIGRKSSKGSITGYFYENFFPQLISISLDLYQNIVITYYTSIKNYFIF